LEEIRGERREKNSCDKSPKGSRGVTYMARLAEKRKERQAAGGPAIKSLLPRAFKAKSAIGKGEVERIGEDPIGPRGVRERRLCGLLNELSRTIAGPGRRNKGGLGKGKDGLPTPTTVIYGGAGLEKASQGKYTR